MRVDPEGWLDAGARGCRVLHLPTVRTARLDGAGALGLVWHATGGVGGPGYAERLARRIQRYRRGLDRPASWHLLIGRDGTVYQSASLLVATWHTGRPGVVAGQPCPNVNLVTIGVELENAGPLQVVGGRAYAWPYWKDAARRRPDPRHAVEAARPQIHDGSHYDGFPHAQVRAAAAVVDALAGFLGWSREAAAYSHSMFAAPAKTDPGRLWMERHRTRHLSDAVARTACGGDLGRRAGGTAHQGTREERVSPRGARPPRRRRALGRAGGSPGDGGCHQGRQRRRPASARHPRDRQERRDGGRQITSRQERTGRDRGCPRSRSGRRGPLSR